MLAAANVDDEMLKLLLQQCWSNMTNRKMKPIPCWRIKVVLRIVCNWPRFGHVKLEGRCDCQPHEGDYVRMNGTVLSENQSTT